MKFPASPRAVVTGAGSGLGRAFCQELARRNARIVLADINMEGLEETKRLLGSTETHVVRCDVASSDDVGALAEVCDQRLGGIDVVVNNAGVAVSGAIGETPLDDWRWIVDINLLGVVYGCHHFAPRLRKQGSGAIVNVASAAGLLSSPYMGAYNATKAAVVALSETLAAEMAGTGVDVTVLCPTFFHTNIGKNARGMTSKNAAFLDKVMSRASIQADGVAKFALDAAEHGELYALPHADGRWFWRLKRVAPDQFKRVMSALARTGLMGSH